jgi:peroxiredoxin
MNVLKSVFIAAYIGGSAIGTLVALAMAWRTGGVSPWLGTALACSGFIVFLASVYARPTPRTSRNLPAVLAAGVVGTAISAVLGGALAWPTLVGAAVGIGGTLAYVGWYSRFAPPGGGTVRAGDVLPSFTLAEKGRRIESAALLDKPALWIFYRGNWCPICVAQVKEICAQYRELARRGVEVFFVSPQSEANSVELSARCDAPLRFMTDVGNRAAAALGIVERHGLPAGMQMLGYDSDVPRPTAIVTAPGGEVLLCDTTDNYRVRPEPARFFAALDRYTRVSAVSAS